MSCCAPNCTNRHTGGFQMFHFPAKTDRRKRWIHNVGRKDWQPSKSASVCEVHFEASQWEMNRVDGWKRLKLTAIPTLFNTPNPPKKINASQRKSKYKNFNFCSEKNKCTAQEGAIHHEMRAQNSRYDRFMLNTTSHVAGPIQTSQFTSEGTITGTSPTDPNLLSSFNSLIQRLNRYIKDKKAENEKLNKLEYRLHACFAIKSFQTTDPNLRTIQLLEGEYRVLEVKNENGISTANEIINSYYECAMKKLDSNITFLEKENQRFRTVSEKIRTNLNSTQKDDELLDESSIQQMYNQLFVLTSQYKNVRTLLSKVINYDVKAEALDIMKKIHVDINFLTFSLYLNQIS